MVNEKRVVRKARAATYEEAEAARERLLRTYRGIEGVDTLDEYLQSWLETHASSVAPGTLRTYEIHVRLHISPLLGGVQLANVKPTDIRRLSANLTRNGVSPSNTGKILTTLRIALGQAYADRLITDNPAAGVRSPRVDREPVRALTAPDVRNVLAAVQGDQLAPLYAFLLGSGLRLGEACGLNWGDVDLDAGTVTVRRSKGKRPRIVVVSGYGIEALRAQRIADKRIGQHEPVFVGPKSGERLQPWTPSHAFPRLLERAGLPRMRVHDLRHGHATRMLARGASMRLIADQLGHANPGLTARVYAHIVPEAVREAVAALDEDVAGG